MAEAGGLLSLRIDELLLWSNRLSMATVAPALRRFTLPLFGMAMFPTHRRVLICSLAGTGLLVGAGWIMRSSHVDLQAERHFVITNWAIHRIKSFPKCDTPKKG